MKTLEEIKNEIADCKEQLRALYEKEATMDPDEYIQVVTASFDDAREMIRDGRIIDAKTALGIQLAAQRLEEEKERKS